jgi:hypothetical protein
MKSAIADALALKYEPVSIIMTNDKPANAVQFKEGKFSCVMFMLAAAVRGRTAVFDRKTFGSALDSETSIRTSPAARRPFVAFSPRATKTGSRVCR